MIQDMLIVGFNSPQGRALLTPKFLALAVTRFQTPVSGYNFFLTYKFYYTYSKVPQTVGITAAWDFENLIKQNH